MNEIQITEDIRYIGVKDNTIDLFEGQYRVPDGISYNSYVILDEKTAVFDTVDIRKTEDWLKNLMEALDGRPADYLIVSHMEPDHAAGAGILFEKFPDMKVVGNEKTFALIEQFFGEKLTDRKVSVKEGDTLRLGKHTLNFFMAPMVHWPEVMVTYENSEKILFSADGFGKFGDCSLKEDWVAEARRYYINIVGKYGAQVAALLKKAAKLDIRMICPLHGPVLQDDLTFYLDKYDKWCHYEPEEEGVLIAYASIYGNTGSAAKMLAGMLQKKGKLPVVLRDLSRTDMAENVSDAFRFSRLVTAAATYDGGLFPCMEEFLLHLKAKNYQKRKVALIENGSWAPQSGKKMKRFFEEMKDISFCDTSVTVKSALKQDNIEQIEKLADELLFS